MNKERPRLDNAVLKTLREGALSSRCVRLGLTTALGASLFFSQSDRPRAQQRYSEPPVSVTGVSTNGGTVSISADGSLNRAQTWQDPEGFHVILVNGKMAGPANGVKVRRVGNSLELVLPVRKGANVTVNPRGNRLDLNVSGGTGDALRVENFETESGGAGEAGRRAKAQRQETAAQAEAGAAAASRRQEPAADSPRPDKQRGRNLDSIETSAATAAGSLPQAAGQQPAAKGAEAGAPPAPAPEATPPIAPILPTPVITPASAADGASVGESLVSTLTSPTSLFGVLGASVFGGLAFALRRRRRRKGGEKDEAGEPGVVNMKSLRKPKSAAEQTPLPPPFEKWKGDRRRASIAVPFERRRGGEGAEDEASRQTKTLDAEQQESKSVAAPAVIFGAYRVDQEVERLVSGQPHSIEVLSSRAADDRRALETSLLKALRAPETDEDGQRRARMALEDYGFVARQCAALLLGAESFDRSSAARTLGEMRSPQALPFLTEALYDPEAIVRSEAVDSIAELGLPSAIGALLDLARRHPDIPASILGPALTACSVESTEPSWPHAADAPAGFDSFDGEESAVEVRALELASGCEELPEWTEEAAFISALEALDGEDAEARTNAAQQLAQFALRRSVEALSVHAVRDRESSVRAAAVTSLGVIGHESVFVPVLLAMGDEAREVRAAAARALSRLNFDRADAYVRVLETADERTLGDVARACVKTGLATQAINRLASEDRRQAYESFSLLSLVVKAGELGPVLETVESHRDIEVRLACIRLLGLTCPAHLGERLLNVANDGGVPEKVRQAIVETLELAGQPR
ncbi:MAG TPA: HEAT repeat domain-containing protein [Pyrinomonadaceae bacterium]|jgi:HEAT repeat protein|nr:HEAT repeat domain-containing protein [Pyrinomonadaceae bacterium]